MASNEIHDAPILSSQVAAVNSVRRKVGALLWRLLQLSGLRDAVSQHTAAEDAALPRHAASRKCLVEIGVAEGCSALALREAAASDARLYLIDPYISSGIPRLCQTKLVARLCVSKSKSGQLTWIEDYSYNAAKDWRREIDFLFIDGNHAYDACLQDWSDFSPYVTVGGVVAFHDARQYYAGQSDLEPAEVVNRLFRQGGAPHWRIIDEVDSMVVVRREL
jgi:hypothetical protein